MVATVPNCTNPTQLARVLSENPELLTPIQPLEDYGYRDTLVLTYRSNGFQDSPNLSQQ
jgi:hypothetical protein